MSVQLLHTSPIFLIIYSALVFSFIYLPILVLIIYSFNRDGVGGFPRVISHSIGTANSLPTPPSGTPSLTLSLSRGSRRHFSHARLLAALASIAPISPAKPLPPSCLLPLIFPASSLVLPINVAVAADSAAAHRCFLGHGTAHLVATTEIFAGLQNSIAVRKSLARPRATPGALLARYAPNLRSRSSCRPSHLHALMTKSRSPFSHRSENTLLKNLGASAVALLPKSTPSPLFPPHLIILITFWYRLRTRSEKPSA